VKDREKRNLEVVEDGRRAPVCSFCGRSKDEVGALIAGDAAYICDECVAEMQRQLRRPQG
jgi:predicted nucleic acid-binding Zn ribbon protein